MLSRPLSVLVDNAELPGGPSLIVPARENAPLENRLVSVRTSGHVHRALAAGLADSRRAQGAT